MEQTLFVAMIWITLALVASLISVRIGVTVALVEILIGSFGGNLLGIRPTDWINTLAVFGSVALTFLAGAEIDPQVLKKQWKASLSIGFFSFLAPFLGGMVCAYWAAGWSLESSTIAGLALSTTSVAVVYTVLLGQGHNATKMGQLILTACFVTDLGTVVALGLIFADYDRQMIFFTMGTAATLYLISHFTPWFFAKTGGHISEPETKYIFIILFGLGALAISAKSEAVLPAYLAGIVLAPVFLSNKTLTHRLRVITFTLLTPFFFLKAGALLSFRAALAGGGLILVFLIVKVVAKFFGVWPLTQAFQFSRREGAYTTLLMSTGLTFGTIASLYGLNHRFISQEQYTILVTAVILSAVIPGVIAERWFDPNGPSPRKAEMPPHNGPAARDRP